MNSYLYDDGVQIEETSDFCPHETEIEHWEEYSMINVGSLL
jgi:hypothetical protein